jgi:fumarate hydratase class II
MGQSSNDVIPSAIHISAAEQLKHCLIPALVKLGDALAAKADEFHDVIKIGRTHLMDATPVRLGQEFGGYAQQVRFGKRRSEQAIAALQELALGGTAVGTGLNRHLQFPGKVMRHLEQRTGIAFREAQDHFEAQGAKDGVVEASGQLKTIAVGLFKIANDIRLLSSGPRCGIGEIQLPATQPGSSIMPGKVNPVMCESLMQVCAWAIGCDHTVAFSGATGGQFQLNIMMPVMGLAALDMVTLLASATKTFVELGVADMESNPEACEAAVEKSLSMVTSLNPHIGYEKAAALAKEAFKTGKTIRQLCREQKILPDDVLDKALDPMRMTMPQE